MNVYKMNNICVPVIRKTNISAMHAQRSTYCGLIVWMDDMANNVYHPNQVEQEENTKRAIKYILYMYHCCCRRFYRNCFLDLTAQPYLKV